MMFMFEQKLESFIYYLVWNTVAPECQIKLMYERIKLKIKEIVTLYLHILKSLVYFDLVISWLPPYMYTRTSIFYHLFLFFSLFSIAVA